MFSPKKRAGLPRKWGVQALFIKGRIHLGLPLLKGCSQREGLGNVAQKTAYWGEQPGDATEKEKPDIRQQLALGPGPVGDNEQIPKRKLEIETKRYIYIYICIYIYIHIERERERVRERGKERAGEAGKIEHMCFAFSSLHSVPMRPRASRIDPTGWRCMGRWAGELKDGPVMAPRAVHLSEHPAHSYRVPLFDYPKVDFNPGVNGFREINHPWVSISFWGSKGTLHNLGPLVPKDMILEAKQDAPKY